MYKLSSMLSLLPVEGLVSAPPFSLPLGSFSHRGAQKPFISVQVLFAGCRDLIFQFSSVLLCTRMSLAGCFTVFHPY